MALEIILWMFTMILRLVVRFRVLVENFSKGECRFTVVITRFAYRSRLSDGRVIGVSSIILIPIAINLGTVLCRLTWTTSRDSLLASATVAGTIKSKRKNSQMPLLSWKPPRFQFLQTHSKASLSLIIFPFQAISSFLQMFFSFRSSPLVFVALHSFCSLLDETPENIKRVRERAVNKRKKAIKGRIYDIT